MLVRLAAFVFMAIVMINSAKAQLTLGPDIQIPQLENFRPLPAPDPAFDAAIKTLVKECGLEGMTPAADNPDKEDEWASICVVDISDIANPRVGGFKMDNFIYPASTYKLYVLGEIVRQVVAGERTLDDLVTVSPHNHRGGSRLEAGQTTSISEVLRLMMQYSDNTAANVAIDIADRRRASALLRAMGLQGSDITRKYLPRPLEDDGYSSAPSTLSCAHHFATFIWAAETSAIGGGKGRGLIKAYMAMTQTAAERLRAGVPASATLMNKTGTWSVFNCDVGLVEDGKAKYIICVMTPFRGEENDANIAKFAAKVHALVASQASAPN